MISLKAKGIYMKNLKNASSLAMNLYKNYSNEITVGTRYIFNKKKSSSYDRYGVLDRKLLNLEHLSQTKSIERLD